MYQIISALHGQLLLINLCRKFKTKWVQPLLKGNIYQIMSVHL